MTRIGYIMIIVGFLAASFVAVLQSTEVNWTQFAISMLVMVAGVVIVRALSRQAAVHADTVAANIEDIDRSLTSLTEKVARLNREKETINTYDMRHKIDEMLLDDISTFVEARETIGIKYGLQQYADLMSHFAAGERYLNRVWSCSADGYIDEVNAFIGHAEDQFRAALKSFQQLKAQHG